MNATVRQGRQSPEGSMETRGRKPRTDNPRRLTVNLPGELRKWLRVHAVTNERDMGDIVAEALFAYRKKVDAEKESRR